MLGYEQLSASRFTPSGESDTATDSESESMAIGAGGTVTGGGEFSGFTDNDILSSITTYETDKEHEFESGPTRPVKRPRRTPTAIRRPSPIPIA